MHEDMKKKHCIKSHNQITEKTPHTQKKNDKNHKESQKYQQKSHKFWGWIFIQSLIILVVDL